MTVNRIISDRVTTKAKPLECQRAERGGIAAELPDLVGFMGWDWIFRMSGFPDGSAEMHPGEYKSIPITW
jgi:hypothetical protein